MSDSKIPARRSTPTGDAMEEAAARAMFADDEKDRHTTSGIAPMIWEGVGKVYQDRWLSRARAALSVLAAALTAAEARGAQAERERDDPEMDATDFAHPAWWRGHDHTFAVMCRMANEVLDGEEPTGTCSEPWESLRQRLWALRGECEAGVRQGIEMARALLLAAERFDDIASIIEQNGAYTNVGFFRKSAERCRAAAEGGTFDGALPPPAPEGGGR